MLYEGASRPGEEADGQEGPPSHRRRDGWEPAGDALRRRALPEQGGCRVPQRGVHRPRREPVNRSDEAEDGPRRHASSPDACPRPCADQLPPAQEGRSE